MEKKTIKNEVNREITDRNNVKTYKTSKKNHDKSLSKWKRKMASIGLAFGLGAVTTPVISAIARNVNEAYNTKQAVEMAASTDKYIESIMNNEISQITFDEEDIVKIESLQLAINDYKELKYKQNKTYNEEQKYMDACKTICQSKELVINVYTDTIKSKVAEIYGITDRDEIDKIEITDPVELSTTDGANPHNPQIVMPDGTCIVKRQIFNPDKEMDSTLEKNIIKARALIDERDFSEYDEIKDLPIDNIIDTFEEAKKFEKNYKLTLDKNGNIKTEKIEQSKETDEPEK